MRFKNFLPEGSIVPVFLEYVLGPLLWQEKVSDQYIWNNMVTLALDLDRPDVMEFLVHHPKMNEKYLMTTVHPFHTRRFLESKSLYAAIKDRREILLWMFKGEKIMEEECFNREADSSNYNDEADDDDDDFETLNGDYDVPPSPILTNPNRWSLQSVVSETVTLICDDIEITTRIDPAFQGNKLLKTAALYDHVELFEMLLSFESVREDPSLHQIFRDLLFEGQLDFANLLVHLVDVNDQDLILDLANGGHIKALEFIFGLDEFDLLPRRIRTMALEDLAK
jgi:hypothetical protein